MLIISGLGIIGLLGLYGLGAVTLRWCSAETPGPRYGWAQTVHAGWWCAVGTWRVLIGRRA